MSKRQTFNRIAVALAVAATLAGARLGVRTLASPGAGFPTLPEQKHGEGDTVSVAFAATGFPSGVTYSATGLPPGLAITTGLDSLGHTVGIVSGTLATGEPLTDPLTNAGSYTGAEGIYNVTISASDGSVSDPFVWDIGRWGRGDLFVGGGEWQYQVYAADGTPKLQLTVPDDAGNTEGYTTGCAVNWHTGEVWATNFDSVYPALNVITRHVGTNPLPYTDPSRRLSTERYGAAGAQVPQPGIGYPWDINPESVTFDNADNMYVGHSFGWWNDNDDVSDENGVATILADDLYGWVYVDAAGEPILDGANQPISDINPISPGGFFERWLSGNPTPTNILDAFGAPIPVRNQAGMDIHKYTPDVNGAYSIGNRQFFDVRYGYTGVDTLDLLSDQQTMNYTSESWYLYRWNMSGAGAAMPVVGSSVVGESRPITNRAAYGLRVLPPGDGTGGYLVAVGPHVERYDASGNVVQLYDVKEDADYPGGDADGWFALAIGPEGRSFWAATRQDVYHFDLASGEVLGTKLHATTGTLHTNQELAGLCVMDEYRAAQEVCGPTGLGNGLDDDGDGTIDEGCFRIEICSTVSPGDDDGDGLVDANDPDCGATPVEQCVADGPTSNTVAGICDRADYEGDTVSVLGVPRPCVGDCAGWTFNYTATGLPPGLTMDPQTGDVTGVPFYTIVNPNSETSPPVVYPIHVSGTWQYGANPASTFENDFTWTIYNTNRAPVAVDDFGATASGGTVSFDVRVNDSDIDGDTFTIKSFTQPATGTGSVVQVGQNLVYTAPADWGGTTTFTYIVEDSYNPAAESNVATVTVVVNGPPVAQNDTYEARWNTTLNIPDNLGIIQNVAGRDSDPEGQPVSVIASSVTAPSHGTVSVQPNGSFSYTPVGNYYGVDTFTYQVTDGTFPSNVATVTITIHRPPVGVPDTYTTAVNTSLPLAAPGIMVNDYDPEGGSISLVVGSLDGPYHGTLINVLNTGAMVYVPNPGFSGVDTFKYRITNGRFESDNTLVTIVIDDAPKAVNDAFTTAEDTPLTATVVTNDTPSLDGGNVWAATSSPAHGSVTMTANGTFTYTPNANYNGTDAFNYRVCDADNDCATATVTITITAVNEVPLAVNDAYTTAEDTPITRNVSTNDTPSPDGGNHWTKLTNPAHGTASMTTAGVMTYTPATNYNGTDSFTYNVCDVDNDCAVATVTITITPVNDVPVAVNDAFTTIEDAPISASLTGNDTPSGDGGNVWSKVTDPAHGAVVVNGDGTFTYTPSAGYSGTDSFTYKVCDVDGDCSTATVTITIDPKRLDIVATPVCIADTPYVSFTITAANFTPVTGANAIVTWKDSTGAVVQTNTVPWSNTSQPLSAQILWPGAVVDTNGQPTDWPGWLLQGGLWIQGSDGFENTRPTSTVEIHVNPTSVISVSYPPATPSCNAAPPANRAPVAVDDAYTTAEDTPITVPVTGILVNDSDPENGPLVVVLPILTQPQHGTVVQNADGSLTYTPAPNYHGTDSYTYRNRDAAGNLSNIATVRITITPVNDVPVAVNDAFTTPEDTPVTGSLTGNDTPSGDGGNVWSKVTDPSHGTVVVNANGTFTYTPAANYFGTDTFTYKVCDVDNDCSTATVTITITSVNEVPVAVNDAYTTPVNTAVTGAAQGNDTASPDGGNVWSLVTNPAHGTVAFQPTGAFVYTPASGYTGTDTFNYRVCDVDNDCASATVTITIESTCSAPSVGVALVKKTTMFDAGSRTEGNVQMLTAVNATFNSNATLAGDLLIPGTPTVQINGSVNYGGTTNGTGSSSPTNHYVWINSGATVGHVVRRTDAVAMPTVSAPANPTGTRSVNINNPGESAGSFSTLRDLTLNSNVGNYTIPAGNYGTFTANSGTSFTLGVAGATTPAVYNFQSLNMNGSSGIKVVGPVVVTVKYQVSLSADAGNADHPEWFTFQIYSGGLNLNTSATRFYGYAVVPGGALIVNSGAQLKGGLAADSLTVNSNGRVILVGQSTCANAVPAAVNDSYTTPEDTPVSGTVKTNDTPSTDGGNTWTLVSGTSHGTVTLNTDGTFTYTPAANYFGTDSFTYKVCDVDGDCAQAVATITITSVNEVPLAVNDAYTTPYNTPLAGSAQGNDTPSPDGGNVWSVVSTPGHGTVAFQPTGTFTYTPATGYSGTDSFIYRVCDVDNDCASATVTITIESNCQVSTFTTYTQGGWGAKPSGNNPGKLLSNNFTTVYPAGYVQIGYGSKYLKFTSASAIANFLPAGGSASALGGAATNPTSSSAGVFAGQVLALQLNVDFSNAGIKQAGLKDQTVKSGKLAGYTVEQVLFAANWALAGGWLPSGITISDLNSAADAINNNYDNGTQNQGYLDAGGCAPAHPPVAVNDVSTTPKNTPVTIALLPNDSDPDDDTLTVVSSTQGSHGTVTIVNNQAVYTPANNFVGTDTFTYTISDGHNGTATATVTVTIVDPNRPPVAVNDAYTTPKNTRLTLPGPGIRFNDSDPDGDPITASLVSTTSHGTLTLNSDGSFSYQPANNYVGTDTFTYRVQDSKGAWSNVATVTITITDIACDLLAVDDSYTTNQNHAITITAPGILSNDQDPYGRGLTVYKVNNYTSRVGQTTSTSHGSVKVNADGSFTYTPASGYTGVDSFTYVMKSSYNGQTKSATVTITINAHYDGDGCNHDRHRYGHNDGDGCDHDRVLGRHYGGDGCDHDRSRNGHHSNDGCSHDRDTHRHYDGDACDHERRRNGHYSGDNCDHSETVSSHYDGDNCDHDRNRSGHRDGDRCDHDKSTGHHNDGDGCARSSHFDGDGTTRTGDWSGHGHSHRRGDGCDHDRNRSGHYNGDRCEHDGHSSGGHDDDDDNVCTVTTPNPGGHDDDPDDEHHSGDYCDHDRNRGGHYGGDGCEHDRVSRHSQGDYCDHDRRRNGHYDGDRCDHDRSQRDDRDRSWGWWERN